MANSDNGEISAWHYSTGQPVRVRWRAGVITHLENATTAPPRELFVAPGLFDLQINGYGGVDFQQDNLSLDDLRSATRQLRAAGCTHFLLTLITDEWSLMISRLHHVRTLRS